MRVRVRIVSAVAAVVVATCTVVFSVSRSPADDGLPKGELSLPHFWVISIGGGDYGIREWRYAGDTDTGTGRRSFTTIFLGAHELSSRLPALAIIALAAAGLAGIALLVVTSSSRFRSTS